MLPRLLLRTTRRKLGTQQLNMDVVEDKINREQSEVGWDGLNGRGEEGYLFVDAYFSHVPLGPRALYPYIRAKQLGKKFLNLYTSEIESSGTPAVPSTPPPIRSSSSHLKRRTEEYTVSSLSWSVTTTIFIRSKEVVQYRCRDRQPGTALPEESSSNPSR